MAYESPELKENPSYQKRKKLVEERGGKNFESKLPRNIWFFLIFIAVCLDALEWLIVDPLSAEYGLGEIINFFIDLVAEFFFGFFFATRGIRLTQARNALAFFGVFGIDILTLGIANFWTLEVGLIILFNKLDEEKAKK